MNFDFGWLFTQFAQTVLPSFVPIVVACIVAFWPGTRPERKLLFVLASAALSWGVPVVFNVLLMPFEFYAIYVEPTLRDHGYNTIPDFIFSIRNSSSYFYVGFTAILSVIVPLYLRSRIWPLVFSK